MNIIRNCDKCYQINYFYFRSVALLWIRVFEQAMVIPFAQVYPKKLWNKCTYSLPGKEHLLYSVQ